VPLRASESDELLHAAIAEAISRKPKGTTSSSTGRNTGRGCPAHEHDRR